MSYCVNCGVELGDGLERCPLCGTLVINPNELEKETVLPFFPTRQESVKPVSKRELALLLTVMLASVSVCCGFLNLALKPKLAWSLYTFGAAAMLWIWFVVPLIWRKINIVVRVGADILAIGFYVLLIALTSDGLNWYLKLALPIIGSAAAIILLASWLMRDGRRSTLMSIVICLLSSGLMGFAAEMFIDRFVYGRWTPSWSLILLAVCVGLSIPLVIIRLNPSLREETRRRFHL